MSEEHRKSWEGAIDAAIEDRDATGDTLFLNRLWAAYFWDFRIGEIVAVAKDQTWRMVRDSARLIERLIEDPTLGSIRLTTASTVADLRAAQAAEKAATESAAADARQSKIDNGIVFTEKISGIAKDFDRGFEFVGKNDLPDLGERFPYLSEIGTEFLDQFREMYGAEWIGKTPTEKWITFERGDRQESGTGWNHALKVGDDLDDLHHVVDGNSYFCDPTEWSAFGDYAYTERGAGLYEINLVDGSEKTHVGSWVEESDPGRNSTVHSFCITPGRLWIADEPGDGAYIRFCAFEPGNTPEIEDEFEMWCSAIHYDQNSETVLALTYKLGLLLISKIEDVWVLHGVIAHKANTALVQYVHFRTKDGRLFLDDHRVFYEIINLENVDKSGGVPLEDLVKDWDRLCEVRSV